MDIIGDASGSSLAWKMVVIWLDKRRWGPPPRLEQTGAEEPRAGCINEQAALKGTGFCNADEWSLQSRDGRREHKGKRGEGEKSRVKWAHREQQWKKALICTSDFCKLVYHVSSATVPHVPSHSILYMPLLDPTIFFVCCQMFPHILCAKWFYYLRWFSNSKIRRLTFISSISPCIILWTFFHHLTGCCGCVWRANIFSSLLSLIEQLEF